MAILRTQFEQFHSKIRFGYGDSQELRDRRDTILSELKANISEDAPSFTTFTQGSYALHTGIVPLGGDPDLDIGVVFDCTPEEYPDPLVLKRYVSKALERHNRTVRIRRPCVTVNYMRDDISIYHIDLAVYCSNNRAETQIAWCRDSTPHDERVWVQSEAKQLIDLINNKFSDEDSDQFRRCIRLLKRWKDKNVGHKNAPSIGLTVAAYKWFVPSYDPVDGKPMDIVALRNLVDLMLFNWGWDKLCVQLPVAPYSDLFENMSSKQMTDLKDGLIDLREALDEAYSSPDTHEASKLLQKRFGEDFPVPDKVETTTTTSAGVSTSGRSA